MKQKAILTQAAPAPIGPYSQAIDTGSLVFFSGQIPLDPSTNQVVGTEVKAQAEQVMKNIGAMLAAAQLEFKHIVKTTIFLVDMNDFASVNEVYGRFFKEVPPARSTVAVVGLPKGVRVEIEVTALRS